MANGVEIELNSEGIRELLQSSEMAAVCQGYAKNIAGRCGEGYETDVYTGKNRVNAMVYPATAEAREDAAQNNTILRSLK